MAAKRKTELETNWLGPSTVFPTATDQGEGQPELVNPTSKVGAVHGLDVFNFIGLDGKRHRPSFAIRAEKIKDKE